MFKPFDEAKTYSPTGAVGWMSPEAFSGMYSRASDVYMFGVTLWELATRNAPFKGK